MQELSQTECLILEDLKLILEGCLKCLRDMIFPKDRDLAQWVSVKKPLTEHFLFRQRQYSFHFGIKAKSQFQYRIENWHFQVSIPRRHQFKALQTENELKLWWKMQFQNSIFSNSHYTIKFIKKDEHQQEIDNNCRFQQGYRFKYQTHQLSKCYFRNCRISLKITDSIYQMEILRQKDMGEPTKLHFAQLNEGYSEEEEHNEGYNEVRNGGLEELRSISTDSLMSEIRMNSRYEDIAMNSFTYKSETNSLAFYSVREED